MPTYEYRCIKCQTVFEVFQSIKASPLRRANCESCCRIMPVKRLIGPGGAVLFKGSGFYQTDYRSEAYRKAAKADTAEVKPSSTDAKADSTAKPADAAHADATASTSTWKESSPGKKSTRAKAVSVTKQPGKPSARRKK